MQSKAVQALHLGGLNALSRYQSKVNLALFENIHTFCLFIGHTKSGNSMIGSLLDAHPNAILADEVDTLRFFPAGFQREQIFYLLLRASRRETLKGKVTARRLGGYSWHIPGQWQGRADNLQVIGDSTSGTTTRRLAHSPELFQQVEKAMGKVKVKFIHLIRNPFDPMSVMMVRGKRSFENAFTHYAKSCDILQGIYQRVGAENIYPIRYETFVSQPRTQLESLLSSLGLSAPEDYLQACAGILHSTPEQARQMVEWKPEWIEAVTRKIDQVDFLTGYTFSAGYSFSAGSSLLIEKSDSKQL